MRVDPKANLVMDDFVSLTYREALTPTLQRFAEHLLQGKLIGHRSPISGNVFIPGRGYDPLTMELTSDADEVEVADVGTITSYTIVTPVHYYGQEATQPFVVATVLLDGASNTIGQQDVVNLPHTEMRVGLRVRAVWKPTNERDMGAMSNRWWGGWECAIAAWEPNGEPDVRADELKDHMI